MASVTRRANGSFEIRFFVDAKRRSFYPGSRSTKKQAESIGIKLEKLAFARSQSEAPPGDVAEWLLTLTDKQHGQLAVWGLVAPRAAKAKPQTLRTWIDAYIAMGNRKESTEEQIRIAGQNLCAFFSDDTTLVSITAGDAEDFRVWLQTKAREVAKDEPPRGLAHNTVRRRIGRAKEIFNSALKRNLIKENPFAGEAAAVGANTERQVFVPADHIERCIKAAPCEDWRIIIALARYAGMRSHETRIQRWEDIDIPNRRMIVRSQKCPKTRICPIFPELMPHLRRAREMAPPGAEFVQTRYRLDSNIGTTLTKIIESAGLVPWDKLFQNLRATRETELLAVYPAKDVASWIGNSVPIAMKHYAMSMQDSFDRAAEEGAGISRHFSRQSESVHGVQEHPSESDDALNTRVFTVLAIGDESISCPTRT